MKPPDKRCCGSGVCIINEAGECWCGQVWDGEKMSAPPLIPIGGNFSNPTPGPQNNNSE